MWANEPEMARKWADEEENDEKNEGKVSMKITRRQLRRLINEVEEESKRPDIRDVRRIVMGLSDALHRDPWPPTVKNLWDTHPNLAAHMGRLRDWFNNKSDTDPGDIPPPVDLPSGEGDDNSYELGQGDAATDNKDITLYRDNPDYRAGYDSVKSGISLEVDPEDEGPFYSYDPGEEGGFIER